jgi:hypothetical protein
MPWPLSVTVIFSTPNAPGQQSRHSAICDGGTSRSGRGVDQLQSSAEAEFMAKS